MLRQKLQSIKAMLYRKDIKHFEQISLKSGGFYVIKMNLVQTVLR